MGTFANQIRVTVQETSAVPAEGESLQAPAPSLMFSHRSSTLA